MWDRCMRDEFHTDKDLTLLTPLIFESVKRWEDCSTLEEFQDATRKLKKQKALKQSLINDDK